MRKKIMVMVTYFASRWPEEVSLLVAETYILDKQFKRGEYPLVQVGDKCIWETETPVLVNDDAFEEGAGTMENTIYWPN